MRIIIALNCYIIGSGVNPGSEGNGTNGGGPNSGITPIGSGDPAAEDFVEPSYYLQPLNTTDDMSNPYHGMQAKDKNGVVYTYDASINAWVLPDLLVLEKEGFEIEFNSGQFENDFDGAILSTVSAIALVEPTPICEIIVGGYVLVVFAYNAYQISTSISDDDWDTCLRLYENLCVGYLCADCLQICRSNNGEWPFDKCPL